MFRLPPVLRGLLWTVLVAFAAGLVATPAGASPSPATPRRGQNPTEADRGAEIAVVRRPPLVVVRGIGSVSEDAARLSCRALLAQLPVRCEIRASRSGADLAPALDQDRGQLDARRALERLFRDRAPDALVEINLTQTDIFEPGKPFVFGLASLSDRVALISLARLEADRDDVFAERLTKLVMHEAGHTLGLHHHDDPGCVMRQDPSVASLDEAPTTPCARCHKRLSRRAKRFSRPGQLALDRARSHLTRGEASTARQLLLGTVWADEYDDGLLLDFGVAFHRAGELDDAVGIFKFLVENSPAHARGHVNLGLAYQSRGHAGDLKLAIRHFERALELHPEWTTVAAHLDVLLTPPAAQGP